MNEQEKQLLLYFAEIIPKLSKTDLTYVAGVIDGMVMAKEKPSA